MNLEQSKNESEIALMIATKAHLGQKDKVGADYILHPLAVFGKCRSQRAKIVALLHDVVEDTNITLEDLKKAGIGGDCLEAIDCVTKRKDESLDDYLSRVASNDIAIEVKFCDMLHNADYTRFPSSFDKEEAERIVFRYADRMIQLKNKAGAKIRLLSLEAYDEVQRKIDLYLVRSGQREAGYKPPLEDVKFTIDISAENGEYYRAFIYLYDKSAGELIGYYEVWLDELYLFVNRVDIRYCLGEIIREQKLGDGNSLFNIKMTSALVVLAEDIEKRGFNVDRFYIAVSELDNKEWIFTARRGLPVRYGKNED